MQAPLTAGGKASLLTPIGYQSGDCGYCKDAESSQRTPNSRASYYVSSTSLRPEHYQVLMDRGWRRSGTLLYLPDAARSCCPHYTIRLPTSEFRPSRDQRQALNRWNRFVLGERYLKQAKISQPKSKTEKKVSKNTFDLHATVHESEESALKPGLEPEHRLSVTLEPDDFTEEKYSLFENYQQNVHHETHAEISRTGFKRFLCSSPLIRVESPSGTKYGSFHQCYRLDGRLIAFSVLDLLPHAISGVYFIYHKDFESWSMGKLSALREATLAGEGGYAYYYMGYYIQTCDKMRYKGSYRQQYILDYETHAWDPLSEELMKLMEKQKYVSMSRERQRVLERMEAETTSTVAEQDEGPESATSFDGISLPVPAEAAASGRSLLELRMPGVLSLVDLHSQVELDKMKISLGRRRLHQMEDIISWHEGSELDTSSMKGVAAEFAACVGSHLAREVVIDFSR